jgi:predicted ribosomally synthesized peptide with SipW-like signal peptide
MSKTTRRCILGMLAGLLAALITGGTAAYFSDSHNGEISGNIGSIKVTPSGGSGADNLDFSFTNLLPGDAQTASPAYQNSGLNPQDVWVVFSDADALHALNQLGTFGEFHIAVNGVEKFASANLNDGYACGTPGNPGVATVCPVPQKFLLESNLAPGANGVADLTFKYASKLQNPAAEGQPFNAYAGGDGLPYQIVATQVGQTP